MTVESSPAAAVSPSQPFLAPRREPASRACDRCRRRKAKCHLSTPGESCTNCREADSPCTYDLPLARRGPKARKQVGKPPNSALPYSGSLSGNPPAELALPAALPSTSVPSSAPWDSANVDPGLPAVSPQTIRSSISDQATLHGLSALGRWNSLARALSFRTGGLEQLILRCFDLFFEYLYPLTPLVHEPGLRDALSFFVAQSAAATSGFSPVSTAAGATNGNGVGPLEAWPEASFTLITAVCAEAAFLLPKDLFPEGDSVADIFLQASRSCLNHYLEADLESPNANSIAIRYFHSNCVHAAGKPKYSWHIFGEATRLCQVMMLNEESSLEGLYPIEAELRRRAFWICYMGDKSASILNNRPITIHKFSFETGITTAYPTGIEDESSIGVSPGTASAAADSVRKTFIAGFNANLRLWQTASDLLLEMRLMQDQEQQDLNLPPGSAPLPSPEHRNRLDSLYVRFVTCLDDLPPYLQSYTFAAIAGGGKGKTQQNQFIIQCANLQVSLHCLRMVITQKFEDLAYLAPGVEQADLRKTEIARDMLCVLKEAPFWVMQVNGEPYVEKIRLIGASLLSIIHRNRDSPLAARARSDFTVLLDILTRLDSKASDALRNNSSCVV